MIIGDAYGPIVGSMLSEIYKKEIEEKKIKIIGDLNNSITYSTIKKMDLKFERDDVIIVIDAALANKKDIGKIIINSGYIKIGEALNRKRKINSDIKIKAIVAEDKGTKIGNYISLKNVKKEEVVKLAIKTIEKINKKFNKKNNKIV